MKTYRVMNTAAGVVCGEYQAPTTESALDTFARDMGYADWYDMWCMAPFPFLEQIWAAPIVESPQP